MPRLRLAWPLLVLAATAGCTFGRELDGAQFACSDSVCPSGYACIDQRCLPLVVPGSCGNGDLDSGEVCDDGNQDDTDACPSTCQAARCGDGFVWAGTESCDDGNTDNDDACSAICRDCSALGEDAFALAATGHCYAFIKTTADFDSQQAACLAAGGHLVTITSEAEQDGIEDQTDDQDFWIGLRTIDQLAWNWVDGTPLDYDHWRANEPNGSGNCARYEVNTDRWRDTPCTDLLVALCEDDR